MREIIQPTSSIELAPTLLGLAGYDEADAREPTDSIEKTNLVDFKTGDMRDDATVRGRTTAELRSENEQLTMELAEQEAFLLNKPI